MYTPIGMAGDVGCGGLVFGPIQTTSIAASGHLTVGRGNWALMAMTNLQVEFNFVNAGGTANWVIVYPAGTGAMDLVSDGANVRITNTDAVNAHSAQMVLLK